MASSGNAVAPAAPRGTDSGPRSRLDPEDPSNTPYQSHYTAQDLLIDAAQTTVFDKDMGLGQYTTFSRYTAVAAVVKARRIQSVHSLSPH